MKEEASGRGNRTCPGSLTNNFFSVPQAMYRNNAIGGNWTPPPMLQTQATAYAGNLQMPGSFQYIEAGADNPYRDVIIGTPDCAPDSPDYQTIAWALQPNQARTMLPTQIAGDAENPMQCIAFCIQSSQAGRAPLRVQLYTTAGQGHGMAMHCSVTDSGTTQPVAASTFQGQAGGHHANMAAPLLPSHGSSLQRGSRHFLNTWTGTDSTPVIRTNREHVRQTSNPYPSHRPDRTSTQLHNPPQQMNVAHSPLPATLSVSPAIAPGSATSALPAPGLKLGIAEFLLRDPDTTAVQMFNILNPLPPPPVHPTLQQAKERRAVEKSRKSFIIDLSVSA